MAFNRIAVIGAGAWGTALALTCARAGREVTLWEPEATNATHLAAERESPFLPGVRLDEGIAIASGLVEAARTEAILLVVPAQAVRAVTTSLAPSIAPGTPVIVCAKGIERGTRTFMAELVAECAPGATPAILSGPSFAADVARRHADGGDTGGERRQARRRTGARDRFGELSSLSFHRCARCRDRRRGQERARHCRRYCRRSRARRQRSGGADYARASPSWCVLAEPTERGRKR